jgi:farnesol dehydrogenase
MQFVVPSGRRSTVIELSFPKEAIMTTLITGGTGFIGTSLARELLRRGEHVRVFGIPQETSLLRYHPNLSVQTGDIRSRPDVRQALEGCGKVYHLAACASTWRRCNDDFFDINVRGTETLLRCAQDAGVTKVVVTSTNLTYGPSVQGAVSEGTNRTTDYYNTYERSKVAADLCTYRFVQAGLPVVTVHPTRVFGRGPLNEANSVTKMIQWYIQGKWRVIPGSGTAIGNYVYLEDLIRGYIQAMENGRNGHHYILGGENISFNGLFTLLGKVTGISRTMVRLPRPAAMAFAYIQNAWSTLTGLHPLVTPGWTKVFLDNWTTSCLKAQKELGYTMTPMSTAFKETISWLQESGHLEPRRLPRLQILRG